MLQERTRILQSSIHNQMLASQYRMAHDAPHWPPLPDTTSELPEEKEKRVSLEKEARNASDRIDRALALERARKKKKKDIVKILLLGG